MRMDIEEMKCPYCGDTAEQEYGDMEETDYGTQSHYVIWRNECPICRRNYYYTEEYQLVSANSSEEMD